MRERAEASTDHADGPFGASLSSVAETAFDIGRRRSEAEPRSITVPPSHGAAPVLISAPLTPLHTARACCRTEDEAPLTPQAVSSSRD